MTLVHNILNSDTVIGKGTIHQPISEEVELAVAA